MANVQSSPIGEGIPSAGEVFGKFRILHRLGSGGMGIVFEAEDRKTGRRVALKLMSPRSFDSPEARRRFRQEGVLASRVSHPNCVMVLDADDVDDVQYIAMELIQGETLQDLVKREGPLAQYSAVEKVLEFVRGLTEAHRCGVTHRDVKPSNCFVGEEGTVKIGDFGLSKSMDADVGLTRTGQILCTIAFASPEQVKGERLDQRTDVYSLAATLYYLLTGRPPFDGADAAATIAHIASSPVPSLRQLAPDVSKGLEAVILPQDSIVTQKPDGRQWSNSNELSSLSLKLVSNRRALGFEQPSYFSEIIAVSFGATPITWHLPMEYRKTIGVCILFSLCMYYGLFEGLLGCTPGKWLANPPSFSVGHQ